MAKRYIPGLVMICITVFIMAIATVNGRADDKNDQSVDGPGNQLYAIMFAPGTSLETAFDKILKADGRVMRSGLFSNIVIAASSDPAFMDRSYDLGAWLVVDPIFAGGCNPRQMTARPFLDRRYKT